MALNAQHQSGDPGHIADHNTIDDTLAVLGDHYDTMSQALAAKVGTSDSRLSDTRVPTDGSVTDAKVNSAAAIAQSKIAGLISSLSNLAPIAGPFAPTQTGAAVATRYIGGTSNTVPTGSHDLGDWVVDTNGFLRVCTSAGTPGTWVILPQGNTATTPQPIGTAAVGTLNWKAATADHVHAQQAAVAPTGLTGAAAATRYVGANATGAPTTGTFLLGDIAIAQNGHIYVCTTAGSPGSWTDVAGGAGVSLTSNTPIAIGTAAVGTGTAAARDDHVHPQQPAVAPTGITGATAATRYAGGTTTGAPSTGTFVAGDHVVAQNGHIWVCTSSGSPGTWVDAASFAVQTARQIIAGTGLTGGGDLSADRTLAVAYGTTSTTAAVGNDARFTTIPTTTQSASYTLVLADAGSCVESTSASAMALTVPPNSSVAFPVNTVIEIAQYGAGQITLTPGAGVTIRNSSSLTTRAQYSSVRLRKRATDEWVASGDLT